MDVTFYTMDELNDELRAARKAIKAQHGSRFVGIDANRIAVGRDGGVNLQVTYIVRTVDLPLPPGPCSEYFQRITYGVAI
jgi:hypothetical protein